MSHCWRGEISGLSAVHEMWRFRNFLFILLSHSRPYTRLQIRP
jgi:hypothetical protein